MNDENGTDLKHAFGSPRTTSGAMLDFRSSMGLTNFGSIWMRTPVRDPSAALLGIAQCCSSPGKNMTSPALPVIDVIFLTEIGSFIDLNVLS